MPLRVPSFHIRAVPSASTTGTIVGAARTGFSIVFTGFMDLTGLTEEGLGVCAFTAGDLTADCGPAETSATFADIFSCGFWTTFVIDSSVTTLAGLEESVVAVPDARRLPVSGIGTSIPCDTGAAASTVSTAFAGRLACRVGAVSFSPVDPSALCSVASAGLFLVGLIVPVFVSVSAVPVAVPVVLAARAIISPPSAVSAVRSGDLPFLSRFSKYLKSSPSW